MAIRDIRLAKDQCQLLMLITGGHSGCERCSTACPKCDKAEINGGVAHFGHLPHKW